MKLLYVGGGTFVDEKPSPSPRGLPGRRDIYPFAYFRSAEHVNFGLRKTAGGPKGSEVDEMRVGGYGMEPLARYWEFKDALAELKRRSPPGTGSRSQRWAFEEDPLVEVLSKHDYNEALMAMGIHLEDGGWEKSGLYDFRDEPPTFSSTVKDYELSEFEQAADDAIDFMYQGDDWKTAYQKLAQE